MTKKYTDQWARWLLHARFGNDTKEQVLAKRDMLYPIRDRILHNARVKAGEVVLDVGCGDGLVAFGALEAVGKHGKVIFSDISQELLDVCRSVAEKMKVPGQCQLLLASADDLNALENNSIDVVTTRSVLIYVKEKQQALHEFYRLLKPGGRISIFEPINSFGFSEVADLFWGYDVRPIRHIAAKVQGVFDQVQPPKTDPMTNFDERDLLKLCEEAGFPEIHLELRNDVIQRKRKFTWESFLETQGSPLIPTIKEAIDQTLTSDEAKAFEEYLRPLVEVGNGVHKSAWIYLWATKY